MADDSEPVRIPITGELDLHTFRPDEVTSVVNEYLAACRERHLASARIVHGKGTGTLRETVHATLRRSPFVESFRIGDETTGGWGATVVRLKTPSGKGPPQATLKS
jgi:DNA-nicking Smr family endonuclease